MGILKELLGVDTLRDLGTVDTTTIGKTQYVTSLSLCRCNGDFQLEVSVLCRGRISRRGNTFYWSIGPAHFESVRSDLLTAIAVAENPTPPPLRERGFSRAFWGLFGFRVVGDIGPLRLTDGSSKTSAYLVKKAETRFLVLTRTAPNQLSEDVMPLSALQAILKTLDELKKVQFTCP